MQGLKQFARDLPAYAARRDLEVTLEAQYGEPSGISMGAEYRLTMSGTGVQQEYSLGITAVLRDDPTTPAPFAAETFIHLMAQVNQARQLVDVARQETSHNISFNAPDYLLLE